MGKRKERRLAAMAAAGRRVKLDLFAEPSGEAEGASIHDEVGNQSQDHHAGVPSSPSSSASRRIGDFWRNLGQQENPLLLLGQYSDDDMDEEAPKRPKQAVEGMSSSDPILNEEVGEHVDVGEDIESKADKGGIAGDAKEESDRLDTPKNLGDKVRENITSTVDQDSLTDAGTQIGIPEASQTQTIGDETGVWKVVMDEQSNQYYYWNTVTGETSWEVPTSGLVLETQATDLQNICSTEGENINSHADVKATMQSNTGLMTYTDASTVCQTTGGMEKGDGEGAHLTYDANQLITNYSGTEIGMSYTEAAAVSEFIYPQQSNTFPSEQFTSQGDVCNVSSDDPKSQHMPEPGRRQDAVDVHFAWLVNYGESLLQRLEALERCGKHVTGQEWIKKEIELRMSDCKALSSYGSSLLPFWLHTEMQLKQLESTIVRADASQLVPPEEHSELGPGATCSKDEHSLSQVRGVRSELAETGKTTVCVAEIGTLPVSDTSKEVETGANSFMPDKKDQTGSLGTKEKCEILVEANPVSSHSILGTDLHAEDVDMDVEMEVDEETPGLQIAGAELPSTAPLEQINQMNLPPPECPVVPEDDFIIPPPPDEEWIPPPPPDNEPAPPPPPEEPPTPSFPPVESVPPHPYQEQYNVGYTVPDYNYYAPVVGQIATNNYYAPVEGCHGAEPQQPAYYEPVNACAFAEASVSPVEPIGYYQVPSVNIPAVPIVSSVESSGYYVEAGAISYNNIAPLPDQTGSAGAVLDSGSSFTSRGKHEPEISSAVTDSKTGPVKAASVEASVQAIEGALVNGTTTDGASVAVLKNQSKVGRSKKRTVAVAPSLRSNKKVSSLVDKWKAAKEELHGEENDEPENAYEILERKRQKEIEEWRARQIASGEAEDNANFIPLGGDWRERVRRRRAGSKAESAKSPSETVENEQKQPDLTELTKDLPSGWQAYWDESTKEVYYGNTITSETTWIRPAR